MNPLITEEQRNLFNIMRQYRTAVAAKDILKIKQFQADYPQHGRMFEACFKAVNRRLRFEKQRKISILGATP